MRTAIAALRSAARLGTARVANPRRTYATLSPHTPPPTTPYEVFDEPSKIRQRDRAILRLREHEAVAGPGVVDYLREDIAERLAERVEDLRVPPGSILEMTSHAGQVTKVLQEVLGDELHPSQEAGGVLGAEKRKWWMVESSGEQRSRCS
jgi:NADH dehydrogenase [ubiquinone] 1 alpha subcomplex assembly factor 5